MSCGITIRVCCKSTSDAAVQPNRIGRETTGPLAGPRPGPKIYKTPTSFSVSSPRTCPPILIPSLRLRWHSQSGASSSLRRLHQPRARAFVDHKLSTVLSAISCFPSLLCRQLITHCYHSFFLSDNSKAGITVRTILCLPRLSFTPFGQAGCMPASCPITTTTSTSDMLYPQHSLH
jgi:hypothetical protein